MDSRQTIEAASGSAFDRVASLDTYNGTTVGWMRESSGRGTLSLISGCLLTMFICTWVVIHRRVYSRVSFGQWHKAALFLKAIVAPEFIAVEGLQEWSQARKIVEDCKDYIDEDGNSLELIHAFFLGMLALRYKASETTARVIWPNQYVWLLQNRLVEWKDHAKWGLSKRDIEDKSNTDGFAKATALVQVFWFVAQAGIRAASHLPISPLESMTISYIPLFAVTYFFWWFKPKDIMSPTVVDLPTMTMEQREEFESMAISYDFDDEGLRKQTSLWNVWYLTPRVFEKEAEREAQWKATQEAIRMSQDMQSQQGKKRLHLIIEEKIIGKEETVVAHWDPALYHSKIWPLICLFGASFGALHLICWESHFPTTVELWLWRASAIVSIVSLLIFMHYQKVVLRWGGPLTLLSIISPALYLMSRVVMLVGAFTAFRSSDVSIYQTVVLSDYWLHIL